MLQLLLLEVLMRSAIITEHNIIGTAVGHIWSRRHIFPFLLGHELWGKGAAFELLSLALGSRLPLPGFLPGASALQIFLNSRQVHLTVFVVEC